MEPSTATLVLGGEVEVESGELWVVCRDEDNGERTMEPGNVSLGCSCGEETPKL
jgi:hypothetical protein